VGLQTSFIVANDKAFNRALDRLGRTVDDFRIPFNLIANHWLRGNRKLFTLISEGLYQPLAPSVPFPNAGGIRTTSDYRRQKEDRLGFDYPIFRGETGTLEAAMTSKTAVGNEIFIGKRVMFMGVSTPHAIFHQSDAPRSKIPQRKLIFIDGGPAEVSRDALISGRLEAWLNIINDHITQTLTGRV